MSISDLQPNDYEVLRKEVSIINKVSPHLMDIEEAVNEMKKTGYGELAITLTIMDGLVKMIKIGKTVNKKYL